MNTFRHTLYAVAVVAAALLLYGCSDASTPTGPDDSGSDGTDGGDDPPTTQFDSEAAPGDSAQAFLSDQSFTELRIEVDYMEGYRPTDEALSDLKTSLKTHLAKSTISVSSVKSIPAKGEGPYTAGDIRALEETHRDHYTRAESDTLWAYAIVVDGEFETSNVVGIAYYNTSTAFFGKTIDDISGGLNQPSREKVEATVFRHEFGHNLGLVNNGTEPEDPSHHDDANGAHCTEEECVMYHTIETTDYFANLFDGTVPQFEQFCTDDMQAARTQ